MVERDASPSVPTDPEVSPAVLTIGYGSSRSADDLLGVASRYGVRYLVDVRSKPYSKFRPEFSREALEAIARRTGLAYLFMGDTLGGLPADLACYTDGRVDYDKVRTRDWFQRGLDRVERGWRLGHTVALMCAELEPERCHRSKLLGAALEARGVAVRHIDEGGALITQQQVLDRLTRGQGALFDLGLTSRLRYVPTDREDQEAT